MRENSSLTTTTTTTTRPLTLANSHCYMVHMYTHDYVTVSLLELLIAINSITINTINISFSVFPSILVTKMLLFHLNS